MKDSTQIADAIKLLREQVKPTLRAIEVLERMFEDARSREWIEDNGVTADKCHDFSEPGAPIIGHCSIFGKWLMALPERKPFTIWNGRIFPTDVFLSEDMDWNRFPGMAAHLPKAGAK